MRKLLFILVLFLAPFIVNAQIHCTDTANLFHDDFEGSMQMTTTVGHATTGDWYLGSTLSADGTQSAHTPVYPTNSQWSRIQTPVIAIDPTMPFVYLSFDHICKVHQIDPARIIYRYSVGSSGSSIQWSSWTPLSFTQTSSFYYGDASSITDGQFSHSSYSNWASSSNTAQPTNTWWHHELLDISQFVIGQGNGQYFQIGFEVTLTIAGSPTSQCAGWYLDNVDIMGATGELAPPSITLVAPLIINQVTAVTNNIGPYQIKASITDNTTNGVNQDSIIFYYTENGGPRHYVNKTPLSTNSWYWMIPTQCYGNIVRYVIEAHDIYCNTTILDTVFQPRFTYTNLTNNAVSALGFYDQPYSLITGNPTPVKLIIQNKSNSPMTSAQITWTLNGVAQTPYNWSSAVDYHPTHDFCLDYKDTVNIGNYIPVRGFDTVHVCVTMRNGTATTGTTNCQTFILFGCDSIMQGSYSVGSPTADFATLNDFYASIENCGLGGPVVAKLMPGTYSGFTFNQQMPGQSAVNTLTFESYTGNPADVIIQDANTAANTVTGAITLTGVSHYFFNKLTLRGKRNSTWSRGVCFTGTSCSNIRITNCIIDIDTATTFTDIKFAGIVRPTTATNAPADNSIFIKGNTITGGNFGIHYLGTSARTNIITNLDSNTICSAYKGIYTIYSNVLQMERNVVTQCGNYTQFWGIHVERSANSVSFSKNKIHIFNNPKCGFYFSNVSNTSTNRVLVSNNEIIIRLSSDAVYGIQSLLSNNMYYINNSVRLYSNNSFSGISACYYHQSGTTVQMLNNIFSNDCISLSSQNFPVYFVVAPTNITSDYNVFSSNGGPIGYLTVARNTLSEWQTATTEDANSLATTVPYITPNTLLELSSYNGFECPVNQYVTTNILDQNRIGEITYRGAYSIAVPQNNLAITELISPVTGTCPQSSYNVTVRVYNMGGNTINFGSTPATISTHSTGGLTLNQTYTINTGSLAPLSYQDYTVISNQVIPYNNPINFTFVVNLPNDNISANDTLSSVFSLEVITPLYDENFSGTPSPEWTITQVAGAGNWTFQSGSGENPNIAPQFGTGRLFFNSKSFSNTTISRAILPVADLSSGLGTATPILEIWFAHDNYLPTRQDGITLYASTNGGTTWTALTAQGQSTALIMRGNASYTTPTWVKYTYQLTNYVGSSCVFFAIEGQSKLGNNVNIDRVRLRMLPNNDCAVSSIYTTSQRPTAVETSPQVKAVITNEGSLAQTNVEVTLTISGANTYTQTITIPSIAYNSETTVTFSGAHLPINGNNTIQVCVESDDNAANNCGTINLVTTNNYVAYSDTLTDYVTFGDPTDNLQVVARYPVEEEMIATAVTFYPTNSLEAVGKKVRGFIANSLGEIITYSDTLTIAANQVNTWVTLPINNYSLTNLSDEFYVGIEMLNPGLYLTAQVEAPIRDSAYYYLSGSTYTPQQVGRFMIGAYMDSVITNELALLTLLSPVGGCDLENEDISVRVTNNGSQDILPGSVLHFQIDNHAVVTETITNTIPSHAVIDYTFNTSFDFTNNMVGIDTFFTVKVWVDHVNQDRIYFNDTINASIISRGKSNLPIVQDTINVNYSTQAVLNVNFPPQIPANGGVIQWFTRENNEWYGPVFEGTGTYTTNDLIFFDTTYYVCVAPGQVYTPTIGTGNTNSSQPLIFNTAGYSRGKILYLNSELGGYGDISKIAINVATAATGVNGIPIKIYIKETDLSALTPGPINWDNEIDGATLIFDEQHFFNTTGWFEIQLPTPFQYREGNILILTETNCGGNNCGVAVSGTTVYPAFKCSSIAGRVQYKTANTNPNFTGNYSTGSLRWNMKFSIADIECASERVPVVLHVPNVPTYDIQTTELVYPVPTPGATQTCALDNEHIQVKYKNLLNRTIPAGTVLAKASFNGTVITHLIMDSFAPLEEKIVTFDQTYDFSAPTANLNINFVITSDFPTEANVYRGNDTLTGVVISTRTIQIPDSIHVNGNFTQTYTVAPTAEIQSAAPGTTTSTTYYFYANEDDNTPFYTGLQYTTPALYDTLVYWIAARTLASPYCQSDRMKFSIDVVVPDYDLQTNELVSPISYQCGVTSPNLVVNLNNTYWNLIPGNTFRLTAKFTDGTTVSQTHTISQSFPAVPQGETPATTNVTFTSPITLGSTTVNHTYNYSIFTDALNPLTLYRVNDTISGVLKVPANPVAPANITQTVPYGQEYTVTPNANPLNSYIFYNSAGNTILGAGTSFLTDPIYGTTTYKYSGRITENNFKESITIGTASSVGALPFVFTATASQGMVLYKSTELGGNPGVIDTIAIYVSNNTTVGSFPTQFYLMNTTLTTLTAGQKAWNNDYVNNATLIFDGLLEFNQGWIKIPIEGGFEYTGGNLLLLTSHNCYGETNVAALNITPPTFRYSNSAATVLYHSGAATTGNMAFTISAQRINTCFSFNYTCESPQGTITLNTSVPSIDLEVADIVTPTTPNVNYSNNQQVRVTLKNHGSTAASGFTVGYKFDNNAPVEQAYSGSIASGGTATFNFTQNVDLSSVYFAKDFTVYVRHNNDNFHLNDTIHISLTPPDPCSPAVTIGATQTINADITNVTFAGINNITPAPDIFYYTPTTTDGRYTDYTQSVAPAFVVQGQSFPISITNSFSAGNGSNLWKYVYIDMNRNNEFEASELVFSAINAPAPTPINTANATSIGSVTINSNADTGLTRMRVVTSQSALSTVASNVLFAPCAVYQYGETEDYAVNIAGPYAVDPGIAYLSHPVGTICPDNAGKIKVILKNFGGSDLIFSPSNMLTLTATVTGAIAGTYTTNVTSGYIVPWGTMEVNIPGVDYSAIGNYNVTVELTFAGDQFAINNTASAAGNVAGTAIVTLPHEINFDADNYIEGDVFPTFWETESTNTNFIWTLDAGTTDNNPNAGPSFDHTFYNTGYQAIGRYAVVSAPSSVNATAVATLTTSCINFHYTNGYPVEIAYWEHFYGKNANANLKMTVEVGSGSYYVALDSIIGRTHTDTAQTFKRKSFVTIPIDEVAKVRFKMSGHSGLIDGAIDDLAFNFGRPDMGIQEFVYPLDFTANPEEECLLKGDTIHPIVIVRNYGNTPVSSFSINCIYGVGDEIDTIQENYSGSLLPGETIEYTFVSGMVITEIYNFFQFKVFTSVADDSNLDNDVKTIISCTTVGIDDYEMENGILLGQNVPNPAIMQTTIPYYTYEGGKATFQIHTIEGQLIYSESMEVEQGEHTIELNTSAYAPGVYFYTLQINETILTKKMIIGR